MEALPTIVSLMRLPVACCHVVQAARGPRQGFAVASIMSMTNVRTDRGRLVNGYPDLVLKAS